MYGATIGGVGRDAIVAEQLLLNRTCDCCAFYRRADRAQGGRLVLVAEVCPVRHQALPQCRACERRPDQPTE